MTNPELAKMPPMMTLREFAGVMESLGSYVFRHLGIPDKLGDDVIARMYLDYSSVEQVAQRGEDAHWLVNRQTRKHIGPFTTRNDALFARHIATAPTNWQPMNRTEFDAYLESVTI